MHLVLRVMAVWVIGACAHQPGARAPACLAPAPLDGQEDPSIGPQYLVSLRAGTDAITEARRLGLKLGFIPEGASNVLNPAFAARLGPEALARLRCEASVKLVSFVSVVTTGAA
jgi:hypothetical protein